MLAAVPPCSIPLHTSRPAAQAEQALERLEEEVWSHLPRGCQAAWDALLARRAEGGEGAEAVGAAELRALLDSCAAGTGEP